VCLYAGGRKPGGKRNGPRRRDMIQKLRNRPNAPAFPDDWPEQAAGSDRLEAEKNLGAKAFCSGRARGGEMAVGELWKLTGGEN
jgi:hypothetical protein